MSDFTSTAALVIFYRSLTVVAGLIIVFFGYRLFRVGVFEKAGEMKAAWGEVGLTLKQAAPGTFFALFGAAVIIFGLWRGITFDRTTRVPSQPATADQSAAEAEQASTRERFWGYKPRVIVGDPLPKEIRDLLGKVAEGETLTSEEQTVMRDWTEKFERFRIQALQHMDPSHPIAEGLRDGEYDPIKGTST